MEASLSNDLSHSLMGNTIATAHKSWCKKASREYPLTLFAYLNVIILIKGTQNLSSSFLSLKNASPDWIRKDNTEVFPESNCHCHLPAMYITNEKKDFIIRKNYDY